MSVKIACPHGTVTGGIELLHQVAAELGKYTPTELWYLADRSVREIPDEYQAYGNKVNNNVSVYDDLIFPEIWAKYTLLPAYKENRKFVFWEGVPAYFGHTPRDNWFQFGDNTSHIAQSEYAGRFLEMLGHDYIEITDYVNDDFLNADITGKREPVVLYNPTKGLEFTEKLIQYARGIRFIPVTGMKRAQIVDLMRKSMVWIDFGGFPGKDKLPREAGACGMCLITGSQGSARYHKDLAIPDSYKLDNLNFADLGVIAGLIRYVIANFDEVQKLFTGYRDRLRQEKEQFQSGIRTLYGVLSNNPCV